MSGSTRSEASAVRSQARRTRLTVLGAEQLTPAMLRLRFRADDVSHFASSVHSDRYVKFELGTSTAPVMRTYTVLDLDLSMGTMAVDFVVHGQEGYGGVWAQQVTAGDSVWVRGPGGSYQPDSGADWHLMACDESGLPAVRAALVDLPADAVGDVVVELVDEAHRIHLDIPSGMQISWIASGQLVDAVLGLPRRSGRGQAFVHGEAAAVMYGIRPHLLGDRGMPRQDVSISGYWRRGRTEEGFRTWKRAHAAAEPAP